MGTLTVDLNEVVQTLRGTEVFEMLRDTDLRRIAEKGDVQTLERGEFLFRANDDAECFYLLLDGAIEIVRPTDTSVRPVPVAYISPGELIGGVALLTGTPRRSTARVPEQARIWKLTRGEFESFVDEMPGYGMELARMFARRLQNLITTMHRQVRRKELSGKLKYFDIPTVVQTLLTSGQNGLLTFVHEAGEIYATILLCNGQVERARCRDIEGEEAFHEIFLSRDEGEFYFRSIIDPDADAVSSAPITMPSMHLLMEAMRRADELAAMREELDRDGRTCRALTPNLTWEDRPTADEASRIFAALAIPRRIADLRGCVPCSTHKIYALATHLIETGQIG